VLLTAIAALGCEARVSLGASCGASVECPDGLVCLGGRCRAECDDARDCVEPLACVLDELGRGACEVVEDASCEGGCAEPLACIDGRCAQACDEPEDCAAGLVCEGGVCGRSAAAPCDVLSGAGCEAGRRCEAAPGEPPHCAAVTVPAGDMRALGEPCSVTDVCEAGLVCAGGRCLRWCLRDAPESAAASSCGAGSGCLLSDEVDAPPPPSGLAYCSQPCDPVAQTGCLPQHRCDVIYALPLREASCRQQFVPCDGGLGAPGCALSRVPSGSLCGPGLFPSFALRGAGTAGPIEEVCLALCEADGDCAPGFTCLESTLLQIEGPDGAARVLGACLPACEAGSCAAAATELGLACDPSGAFCTAGCDGDDDCYATLRCLGGRCTPR
jgi:hypothetical protein